MENIKEQKRYLKKWYNKTAKRYDFWISENYKNSKRKIMFRMLGNLI